MSDAAADSALRSIRDLLDGSAAREVAYTPNPVLTAQDVRAWEELSGFGLPEQYRAFLTQVGNGGRMPGSYCDFVVEALGKVWGRWTAAAAFPVSAERLQERFRQLEAEDRPVDGVLFPELEAHWSEADRPPGCLVFGQYPSGDHLFLVTTGDLRGSVWCSVCWGIPEVDRAGQPIGFLSWFADVLAELTGERP
jgi:hypothetical protein